MRSRCDVGVRLAEADKRLLLQHRADPASCRLATIPGIGPIGAMSLVARVDATQFGSGRHLAASPQLRT